MPAPGRPTYAVPALEKGLDLLEALAQAPGGRSQSDLARQLGRSSSEIFRMLACLERRGYVEKDAQSLRYQLTLRLFALAHTQQPIDHLLRCAFQPMRDLARSLDESCHLSVIAHGRLVVLAQVESTNRIRLSIAVGALFPVIYTLSGRLLLAHATPEARADHLAHDADAAELDPAARTRLDADLEALGGSRVASATSDLTSGVRDAAALVGNARIGVCAALCVPALIAIGRPKPLDQQVREVARAADAITRALGLEHVHLAEGA
jgi:DNA-binding IclR family transcriptional regulator